VDGCRTEALSRLRPVDVPCQDLSRVLLKVTCGYLVLQYGLTQFEYLPSEFGSRLLLTFPELFHIAIRNKLINHDP